MKTFLKTAVKSTVSAAEKTTFTSVNAVKTSYEIRKTVFASLALAALCVSSAQVCWANDTKIGTVDMQKALQTVDAGKKAKAQLEKEFNNKKKELQAEEAAIKKMTEEFKKQSLVMSDEARGKKQNELQERIMKFQELTARSQGEIQQKERDLTQPIILKLRSIIAEAAKKHEYTVVLEKNENNVLYSQEKDDLTSEVVTNFDKAAKADNKQAQTTSQVAKKQVVASKSLLKRG